MPNWACPEEFFDQNIQKNVVVILKLSSEDELGLWQL